MNEIRCPACKKRLSSAKALPKHTNGCPEWASEIGVPPSEFNFEQHFGRGLFAEGLTEGVDYVSCHLCALDGRALRKKRLSDHLRKQHGLSVALYEAKFPDAPVRLLSTLKCRERTTQARYGVDNVFQAEEIQAKAKETSLRRYGIENGSQALEVRTHRAQTNRERYGHENPFGSTEVQAKARRTMLERHGAESPQQVPEIRARTLVTNRERFGKDHYVETEGFQKQFKATSQENWGEDHPMQSDRGHDVFADAYENAHGVRSPFHDPEVQRQGYETNLRNHGGQHSQKCPDVRAKAKATWMEKYGVDNPSKVEAVKIKVKETWIRNYGVPFPPQSLWLNRTLSFPNKLEQKVDGLSPSCMVYAGDGSYWIRPKGSSRSRNPDFVVLTRAQLEDYKDGAKLNGLRTYAIVEIFGDFWHGPTKTGKSRKAHQAEVVSFYKKAGITCLVLWESEVNKHPKQVQERLRRFLEKSGF